MSSRAPIGYLSITGRAGTINQGCKAFVCNSSVSPEYLLIALEAQMSKVHELGRGSTFAEVSKSALEGLELPLHSPDRQAEVVGRIQSAKREIAGALSASRRQTADASALQQRTLVEAFFPVTSPVTVASNVSRKKADAGWPRLPLLSVARLASGHTPSRRRPDWWGGHVPWLALPDIRKLHGKVAHETTETINDAGLANSSARLLPVSTVCLCRDASIGFVTMLGRPMATSQHFCNWVCDTERLDPEFLMYAFMASFDYLRELGSGSVLKTIYMPTIESFHVCAPPIDEQRRIARTLRAQLAAAEALQTRLAERQAEIERLPQRILAAAFGEAD
jgi:type I restriction enzyme, S subunit